jgi:zinc/manganese transport system substrate-binding protein
MRIFQAAATGAILVVAAVSSAEAKLNVFACVPEWAALTNSIGGDRVDVHLATNASENPETLPPTPGMITAMDAADMFVCTGVDLEGTWLPEVLKRTNNPKVADSKESTPPVSTLPGQFYAAQFVQLQKDDIGQFHTTHHHVHWMGNGHIEGDPRNIVKVAAQLAKRLIQIDPDGKDYYTDRTKKFIADLNAHIPDWEKKAAPLKGLNLAVQHEHTLYTFRWLGIKTAAMIEIEPGVEPGPEHLTNLITSIPQKQIKFIVYGAYEDPKESKYVAEKAGVPLVKVPVTIGGTDQAKDFVSLYDDIINRLLDGLAGRERS